MPEIVIKQFSNRLGHFQFGTRLTRESAAQQKFLAKLVERFHACLAKWN